MTGQIGYQDWSTFIFMKNYYIYKITNKANERFYIGKTCRTIQKRFEEHLNKSKNGDDTPLHLAMAKYGRDSFEIIIIEQLSTLQEMNLREKYWIDYYKRTCPDMFYNIADGGDGGATCNNYSWWNDGEHGYYFAPE